MEHNPQHNKTHSHYSAIFAVLLILLIIITIAYNAFQNLLNENGDAGRGDDAEKRVVVENLQNDTALSSEDTILYENLTDEEAARIIEQLLSSGEKSLEELEKLEKKIAEE